jgi:hypothetical protein
VEFCDALGSDYSTLNELIKVVPTLGVIYVVVPKAASTRIKLTLAKAVGRHSISLLPRRRRRFLRTVWTAQHDRLVLSSARNGFQNIVLFVCAESVRARSVMLGRQMAG